MRSPLSAWWTAPVAVVGVSGVAEAQAIDGREIEQVTIVSKGLEETLPSQLEVSGSRVTTITAAEIRNGGFNDLGQVLQYSVPSLYLSMTGGQFGYADVSLQGSRPGDILWLVDGVRVNNRLYSGTLPLDTLPAHMIERIEVLEGGQGLMYGSQAIAGVINVVSKAFTDQTGGEVALGFDDNEGKHGSAFLRGSLGGTNYVLYGSVDEGDGYQPFRDRDYQASATDRERGYDVKTAGFKLLRDFTGSLRFSTTYQHTDADIELLRPMWIAKNVNSRDEDLLSAKLDVKLGDTVDFFVKGYYHDWDTRYTTLNNSLTNPGTIEVDSDNLYWGFYDYGVNTLLRLGLTKGLDYYLGYDVQKYGGRDDVLLIADNSEKTQAFFAQVRTTDEWLANLHLTAGLRYNDPSDASSETVWTATGKYDITPNLFVRGVVGTGFKLPTAEELYAIDPFEHGNPNLKPEKSRNLNLSVGGALGVATGELTWEVVGFAREISNLISWEYDEALDLDVATNVPGEVKVRGGQAILTAPLGAGFRGRVSFMRGSSENAQGRQIARIPRSALQASFDYSAPSGRYGAALTGNRIGDVFESVLGNPVNYGDYTVVDLTGRYFLDEARRHRLNLRLENAFDEEYGRPGTGRTDASNAGYAVINLGTPRTLHAAYSYSF